MTMNNVYEISTPNGDIKEIEIDGKTAWERAVDETKTGATPIIANATRGGNASEYKIWGNAPYQEHTPSPDNPCEIQGVGERTKNLFDIKTVLRDTRIVWATGKEYKDSSSIDSDYSDFIKVEPNTSYTSSVIIFAVCFNANKEYLGVLTSDGTYTKGQPNLYQKFTTLSDTEFIRLCTYASYGNNQPFPDNTMFSKGGTYLPYEPYGYRIPVVNRVKNLFGERLISTNITSAGLVAQNSYNQQYDLMIAKIKSGETYTISSAPDSRVIGFFTERPVDKSTTYDNSRIVNSGSMPTTIIAPNGVNYIAVRYLTGYKTPQIELGTTATEYEPYRETITTTIYSDEPYFTGDYIRKDKAGGVEHREWGKYELDGVKAISKNIADTSDYLYWFDLPDAIGESKDYFLCNHLPSTNAVPIGDLVGISYRKNARQGVFYINFGSTLMNTIGNTRTALQAWLKSQYDAGTPVTIYYQLATPTDTEKDLPEILLVNGYNAIDTDTEIKPEKMSITYLGKDGN